MLSVNMHSLQVSIANEQVTVTMKTRFVVGLVIGHLLWQLIWADVSDVLCRWNVSCILGVSFNVGDDVVIHWSHNPPGGIEVQVHSFYYDTDQMANQGMHFRERTSLFKENISVGNASLLLKDVLVEDEGIYKCYVGTLQDSQEFYINLHVEAPIQDVRMELRDKAVFCRVDGVYPPPTLNWSTDPPLDNWPFEKKTKVEQTQSSLYNVESCMQLKVAESIHVEFTCEVTGERNSKKARFRTEDAIQTRSGYEVKIPCSFPTQVQTFDLIWRFRHSEHILSMKVSGTQRHLTLSEDWKIHVMDGRSAWRHLKLPNVVPDHQGTYTCEVRTSQVTYVTQTDVIVIPELDSKLPALIGIIILIGVLLIVFVSIGFLIRKMRMLRKSQKTPEDDDSKSQAKKEDNTDKRVIERLNLDFLSSVLRQRYAKFMSGRATIFQGLRSISNNNAT